MSNRKDLFKSFISTSYIDGVKWQIVVNNVFAFVHPIFGYIEDIDAEVAKAYDQLPEVIKDRYFAPGAHLFIVDAVCNKVVVTDII